MRRAHRGRRRSRRYPWLESTRGGHGQTLQNSIAWPKASWGVLREDKKLDHPPAALGRGVARDRVAFVLPIAAIVGRPNTGRSSPRSRSSGCSVRRLRRPHLRRGLLQRRARVRGRQAARRAVNPRSARRSTRAAHGRTCCCPGPCVSATVSLVLRTLEERAGIFGRIVVGARRRRVVARDVPRRCPMLVIEHSAPIARGEAVGRAVQAHVGRERHHQRWSVAARHGRGDRGRCRRAPADLARRRRDPLGIVIGLAWIAIVSVVVTTLSGICRSRCTATRSTATSPDSGPSSCAAHSGRGNAVCRSRSHGPQPAVDAARRGDLHPALDPTVQARPDPARRHPPHPRSGGRRHPTAATNRSRGSSS